MNDNKKGITMVKTKIKQEIQEKEYNFPYHYIPTFDGHFRQFKNLRWGYIYLSYINLIISIVNDLQPESLLDIGCGDGRFLHELRKKNSNIILEGKDISEQSIAYAKAFNINSDITFTQEDIVKAKDNKKFECITLIETLEHIPPEQINSFLKSISYRLVDKGKLILTVPSKNVKVDKKHFQHFDIETLKSTTKNFFEIENYFYINSKSRFVKRIDKIVNNKNFVITNKKLINWLYFKYCKHFLYCKKNNCKRILAILNKK